MIRRHPPLIKENSAVGRICKFRLPMGENSFKNDLLWKSILVIFSGERKLTSQVESSRLFPKQYPMHFPSLDGKKSNPSHEFVGDRKNLLAWWWWCFRIWHYASVTLKQTSGQTNRVTYFPRFAFNLFFLRLFSLLIHILLVGLLSILFVCFTFSCSYFLIKWKVCLFYDGTKQFNHTHW